MSCPPLRGGKSTVTLVRSLPLAHRYIVTRIGLPGGAEALLHHSLRQDGQIGVDASAGGKLTEGPGDELLDGVDRRGLEVGCQLSDDLTHARRRADRRFLAHSALAPFLLGNAPPPNVGRATDDCKDP